MLLRLLGTRLVIRLRVNGTGGVEGSPRAPTGPAPTSTPAPAAPSPQGTRPLEAPGAPPVQALRDRVEALPRENLPPEARAKLERFAATLAEIERVGNSNPARLQQLQQDLRSQVRDIEALLQPAEAGLDQEHPDDAVAPPAVTSASLRSIGDLVQALRNGQESEWEHLGEAITGVRDRPQADRRAALQNLARVIDSEYERQREGRDTRLREPVV